MHTSITPKLFSVLNDYKLANFSSDCKAGILVGIIAFPLALALSVSSGVTPEMGINTAIIGGFLIAFFGGSRVQIGGPTAAFIPIVFNIVGDYGVTGLLLATIMAGIFLIIMGLCRFGVVIKYIPYPMINGITSGIAISILLKQWQQFLGLKFSHEPTSVMDLFNLYWQNFQNFDHTTVIIGSLALLIIIITNKKLHKINKILPGSILAILVTTLIMYGFDCNTVATIGSTYPNLKINLLSWNIPLDLNLALLQDLLEPAFSIAVLAGIESLLSAVISDGMIGDRHRSNAELIAQGIANVCCGLCGGIPATAAIARTATNVKNGGRTPIAGMVHAITIFLIIAIWIPYVAKIPLACLAAILIIIAWNMGEWHVFRDLRHAPKSDSAVFLTTLILVVFWNITIALKIGLILAGVLFIKRMAEVTEVKQLLEIPETDLLADQQSRKLLQNKLGNSALFYEINGPFFFGAADKLADTINQITTETKLFILKMHEVPTIDSSGYHTLTSLYKTCKKHGVILYCTHIRQKPYKVLQKSGLINLIGPAYFCKDLQSAMQHYQEHHHN